MVRKRLEYFITLADTLSFTKAAKKHFIAQTTMSRQIAILEEEIGFELFERNTIKVILTPAGQTYLEEVKDILKRYDMAVNKAALIAMEKKGILRIGHAADLSQKCLAVALEVFQEKYKEVEITITQAAPGELIKKLQLGDVDIVAVFEQELEERKGINSLRFLETEVILGMSKNHPLAEKKEIDPIELEGETICVATKDNAPHLYEYSISCCRKDGYEPNVIEADSFDSQKLLAQLGKGIGMFPDTEFLYAFEPYLSYVKMKRTSHKYIIDLAWHIENKNQTLINFLEIAKTIKF